MPPAPALSCPPPAAYDLLGRLAVRGVGESLRGLAAAGPVVPHPPVHARPPRRVAEVRQQRLVRRGLFLVAAIAADRPGVRLDRGAALADVPRLGEQDPPVRTGGE